MSFGDNIGYYPKKEVPINPIPPQAEVWRLIVQPGASDQQWQSVAYGNGIFVAVSAGGTSGTQTITSPDGINWTNGGNFPNPGIILIPRSVIFGNGMFVAACSAGSVARLAYSVDGKVWTLSNTGGDLRSRQCVCFSNELGLFVAMGTNGTSGQRAMTSYDGINWTLQTTPAAGDLTWEGVTYGNGLFVAVASNGNDRVMTSPDGVNWTVRDTGGGDAIGWREICYGNGVFVAVGTPDASNNAVMTSPDGIVWTLRTVQIIAGGGGTWFGVVYAGGTFVAVGSGTTNSIMKSVDNGITWTKVTTDPQTNQSWLSVTYGNGIFVAVANVGGTRIMVSGATYNSSDVYENTKLNNIWRFIRFVAPGSAKIINVGGAAKEFFTDVPNVGTAETDLYSYSVEPNVLSENGQKLSAHFVGLFIMEPTALKAIKIYFAGTVVAQLTPFAIVNIDETWTYFVSIIRVSSTVVRVCVESPGGWMDDGAGNFASALYVELTALDLTIANILKITGQVTGVGAGSDQIIAKMGKIDFSPTSV